MEEVLEHRDLAVMASPMRQRLLAALSEPDSAAGLARRLGMSRQRVGYHMRELERGGFLELLEQRPQRGCTERIYRAKQITYVLEPDEGDERVFLETRDRFSWAGLVHIVARALRELVALRKRADREGKRLATLAMQTELTFASPSARKAFSEELTAAIKQVVQRYHSEESAKGRRFRVFLGAYPAVDTSTNRGGT